MSSPGPKFCRWCRCRWVYVTANFKETQLTRMRPGQRAESSRRRLSRSAAHRPDRELRPGERRPVQPVAARQRDRQFHQDRAARPGADRAAGGRAARPPAAARPVGHGHGRYPRAGRRRPPRGGIVGAAVAQPAYAPRRRAMNASFRRCGGPAAPPAGPAGAPTRAAKPRPRHLYDTGAGAGAPAPSRACATGSACSPWSSACSWRSWTSRSSPAP